jgi:hypothetical protein
MNDWGSAVSRSGKQIRSRSGDSGRRAYTATPLAMVEGKKVCRLKADAVPRELRAGS